MIKLMLEIDGDGPGIGEYLARRHERQPNAFATMDSFSLCSPEGKGSIG
jgi:hypothetical protein